MSDTMVNELEMDDFLKSLETFDDQAWDATMFGNVDSLLSCAESNASSPLSIDVRSLPTFDAAIWSSLSPNPSQQQQRDGSMPAADYVSTTPMRMKSGSSKVSRRKEQNRFAQRAFRDRQRRLVSELQAEIKTSCEKITELTAKNQQLEQRMQELQREMMLHFATVHGASELLSI